MSKQTIAQQLGIKEFPFEIKNKNGKVIYYEYQSNRWYRQEFDPNGNLTYNENSEGYWCKQEFNSQNERIYFENSYGELIDNRQKEIPMYTMSELIEKIGHDFIIKE